MATRRECECADRLCPAFHNGEAICLDRARMTLFRVDMVDQTGTRFCEACGADSLESGLFRERR